MKYSVNAHSSIRIQDTMILYIDPFQISVESHDADIVFVTHSHYDHLSKEDLLKVIDSKTVIVLPESCLEEFQKLEISNTVFPVIPNQTYRLKELSFETLPAYNINKPFHPKENGWVGYRISMNHTNYYIAGDTDELEENSSIECDVAFVPIGGTYTMTAGEAAHFANKMHPRKVIPIHYGSIVGTKEDVDLFVSLLNPDITYEILI